jgi:hypothetical protein
MMGLANREIDGRLAGLDTGQKLGQAHESGASGIHTRSVSLGAIAARHDPNSHPTRTGRTLESAGKGAINHRGGRGREMAVCKEKPGRIAPPGQVFREV